MSNRDCSLNEQYYNDCLTKNENDTTKCKWLFTAIQLCKGEVNREKLLLDIENDLKVNPKTPTKKICCTCPETKKARDDCFVTKDNNLCNFVLDAHKLCLRSEGFDISKLQ